MLKQIQKEDKKNKLLPYSKLLEEEAFQQLKEIKANLGSCILLRESREPFLYWLSRLGWYVDLYGLNFSKEDHILFVRLIYDFITIPDIPLNAISPLYVTLRILLRKKKFLVPRQDLTLPWRPLYNLCKKVFWSGYLNQITRKITQELKLDLEEMVLQVRYYFDPSATQDILDELRPYLCPSDTMSMKYGVQMLSWFLPLTSAPELGDSTYKLWLDEMLRLWDACSNNAFQWEDNMMYLTTWLAVLNTGNIDWEEYIPTMYSRVLRIFKLPVYYKKNGSWKFNKILEDRVTSWIVSTLGGGSVSQDYLDQLLRTLESYCHSANIGYWTTIIKSFLNKISRFFILRIKRERFSEPFWQIHTPEEKKLNDEDIKRFVTSMQSIAMSCIFTPVIFSDMNSIFQELATLRPDIVIPPLLDRLYATIDCVTEPHKLTALLQCVRAVARPMLTNGLTSTYEDGKKHVIPLLFAVLPGIDPNDLQKSIVTLQFISTFLNMIPVVDCSSCSRFSDLTPVEEEVASATSQFEEFVLQYMERIFTIIESIAQENVRIENHSSDAARSKVEKSLLVLLEANCMTVFGQVSSAIFSVALKKMYNYSMAKIFEREVAGQAIAVMLKSFSSVNAEETYKLFIPQLTSFILEAMKSADVKTEERLDSELLYKMLLLSEILCGSPMPLKQYMPILMKVLDETLHLKCKEAYERSNNLLTNILTTFSHIHPTNFYNTPGPCDANDVKSFPVREWGVGTTFKELHIQWYCPEEEEISLIEQIFWKYLVPELEIIDKYNNNEIEYSRDNIRCTLKIILALFNCELLLARWEEEPFLAPCDSKVPFLLVNLHLGVKRYIRMPDGSNVYKVVIEKMATFQSKLLEKTDDTVSFHLLIKIWAILLHYNAPLESNYHGRKQFLKRWKRNFINRAGVDESTMQSILTEDVYLKHLQRIIYNGVLMTCTHQVALRKLLDLATCDYKPVQAVARNTVQSVIICYTDYSCLIDGIVDNLKVDTTKYTEKFKGTLLLLKDKRAKWFSLFSRKYAYLKKILPAIATSMPSEEPAVVKLLDDLREYTTYTNWQFAIRFDIPDYILEEAKKLWTESEFQLSQPLPSASEIETGLIRLNSRNDRLKADYDELIQALLDVIQNNSLQWRYETMAATYLAVLLHPEQPGRAEVVRYFLRLLIHDSVVYRKIAIKCVVGILKLYKKKTVKEIVDTLALQKDSSTTAVAEVYPGPRPDNEWCRHQRKNVPKNEKQWNEVRYTYRCYLGFYCWPKEIKLCSSPSIQPMNTISIGELSDIGNEIDTFFTTPSNVDKLMEYFSLEEIKGESLRCFHIAIFKYLFKIHGNRYLEIFKPHFERLLEKEEDSHQRCAAEVFAGIMQGSKLWPFDQTQQMISWCMPLLRKALDNMTVETQKHWGSALATAMVNCDVNKSSYLLELLMEKPIKGNAAFKDCGRLYALQSGVMHSWRLSEFWCKLLEYIKPHLANDYQNLRERLGSVLVTIFESDIETNNWNRTLSPHVADFIDYLVPKLEILYSIAPNSHDIQGDDISSPRVNGHDENEAEVQEAIQLLKTVCKWSSNSAQRSIYPLKCEFFKIFPLLCFMENYDKDDELKKCCKQTLSLMSYSLLSLDDIPVVLQVLDKVAGSKSWCAKCTCLDFLQVFAFHNLFSISSRIEWISKILDNVLQLLVDSRCEVRQKAGEVISGFIHYNLIKDTTTLIEKFKSYSSISLKIKSNLNIRHAGVIGFCSFINAYPYTVPPEIPPLFLAIRDNLKDPEPIPSTIRKTLGNFKRTHYANWEQSKLQFTADELDVFTDIMIPPNHYA